MEKRKKLYILATLILLAITVIVIISVTVSTNNNENDTTKETKTKKTGGMGRKGESLNFVYLIFLYQKVFYRLLINNAKY